MADDRKQRVVEIVRILRQRYPHPRTALNYENPFQLLVATILSAQSTDVKVNQITPGVFKKYPSPEAFASADPRELEQEIRATGFFRQKTRAIMEASQDIVSRFGGKVPHNMEDLTTLRGVGRKTANVILSNAFGKPAIPVDTHVLRVSGRLRLVDPRLAQKKEADKVEQELMEITPRKDWNDLSHMLIYLGREICTARNPQHDICPILHLCPTGQREIGNGRMPH